MLAAASPVLPLLDTTTKGRSTRLLAKNGAARLWLLWSDGASKRPPRSSRMRRSAGAFEVAGAYLRGTAMTVSASRGARDENVLNSDVISW